MVEIVKGISNSNRSFKPIPSVKDDGDLSSDINSDDEGMKAKIEEKKHSLPSIFLF